MKIIIFSFVMAFNFFVNLITYGQNSQNIRTIIVVKAKEKDRKILEQLIDIKKSDQLFRGQLSDKILDIRSQAKDPVIKKLCWNYFDGLMTEYQLPIDRENTSKLLAVISKVGYWDKFVLDGDTLSTSICILHIPLMREDSMLREKVKKMAETERKLGHLSDGYYATIKYQLNQRKGKWEDYLPKGPEVHYGTFNRILVVPSKKHDTP